MALAISLLKFFVYLILTISFYYGSIFDTGIGKSTEFPFDSSFGGKAKFLTYLNLFLDTFYFALCTINAAFTCYTCKNHKRVKAFLDMLYNSLVFPIGSSVTIGFWSLFFIDRDLIFPEAAEKHIQFFINHIMHTLPLTSCIADNFLTYHSYSKFFDGFKYTLLVGILYLGWVFYMAYVTGGKWVYPVLTVLDNYFRALFCFGQLFMLFVFYKIGEFLNNNVFWKGFKKNESSNNDQPKKKSQKNKKKYF